MKEVSIITDHKPLVAIFKEDAATLSLKIHHYRVRIIYKPGPDKFIADWLSSKNHKRKKDAETHGKQLNIEAIQTTTNIPECMTIHDLQQAIR